MTVNFTTLRTLRPVAQTLVDGLDKSTERAVAVFAAAPDRIMARAPEFSPSDDLSRAAERLADPSMDDVSFPARLKFEDARDSIVRARTAVGEIRGEGSELKDRLAVYLAEIGTAHDQAREGLMLLDAAKPRPATRLINWIRERPAPVAAAVAGVALAGSIGGLVYNYEPAPNMTLQQHIDGGYSGVQLDSGGVGPHALRPTKDLGAFDTVQEARDAATAAQASKAKHTVTNAIHVEKLIEDGKWHAIQLDGTAVLDSSNSMWKLVGDGSAGNIPKVHALDGGNYGFDEGDFLVTGTGERIDVGSMGYPSR